MELVQARFVTDDVPGLAAFYARLVRAPAVLNDYYVEVQAGPASVGFCRRRFTEYPADLGGPAPARAARALSSSTSRPMTPTPSTRGLPRSASTGSCGPPPSPGAAAA